MTPSVPSDSALERSTIRFLEAMAAAGNPGLTTIRVHAGPGGRREAWRFSIRVWGEYALEPHGDWWHGDALPPDYRVRWRRATHDDVARAVSPSDLLETAARNGISLATRVRQ
jgi:hypothetical protein